MNKSDKMTQKERDVEIEKINNIVDMKVTEDNSSMISALIKGDLEEKENILKLVFHIYEEYQKLNENIFKFLLSKQVWWLISLLVKSVSERKHALFHLFWDFGIVPEKWSKYDEERLDWITRVQLIDSEYMGAVYADNALDAEKTYLRNALWTTDIENLKLEDAWRNIGIVVVPEGRSVYRYVSKDHKFVYDEEIADVPDGMCK